MVWLRPIHGPCQFGKVLVGIGIVPLGGWLCSLEVLFSPFKHCLVMVMVCHGYSSVLFGTGKRPAREWCSSCMSRRSSYDVPHKACFGPKRSFSVPDKFCEVMARALCGLSMAGNPAIPVGFHRKSTGPARRISLRRHLLSANRHDSWFRVPNPRRKTGRPGGFFDQSLTLFAF